MAEGSINVLRERGVRVTPHRSHTWRVLAESEEHLTAEEVWGRAREAPPCLELSTVYRSLEALRTAGLVADSRLPEGPRVFEARSASHPHLECEGCGEIFHPDSGSAAAVRGVERRLGRFRGAGAARGGPGDVRQMRRARGRWGVNKAVSTEEGGLEKRRGVSRVTTVGEFLEGK